MLLWCFVMENIAIHDAIQGESTAEPGWVTLLQS